jgi:hypothetical protein
MRGKRILRALKIAAIVMVAFTVFGFVVTHLWNYLMPAMFGLRTITFWQAVGLMVLGRLLLGGIGPRFGGAPWRRHMMERWEQMTPEQREKFRESMRGRCGHSPAPAAETKP